METVRTIYTDNNATTAIHKDVYEGMIPFLTDTYGNPSSMHAFGGKVEEHVTRAREQVATLLGAEPYEIVFTSCGTESDNMAIRGILDAYPEKKHIITTKVEHPAVLTTVKDLERKGYEVSYIDVNAKGDIDLHGLQKEIRPTTGVISVMYANNETGVIFPVEKIGEIAKSHGIPFHVDAVQAVGKLPLDMKKSSIDLLALSGHKLHAPKGIGALYIRKGTRIRPIITGGHQERGRRGGTENVPYIVGLGITSELAMKNMEDENTRVKALRDTLEAKIVETIPNVRVNGGGAERLPNTLNVSFRFIEGEAILLMLDEYNICASSGSACTSGSLEPSHVLRAMGVPFDYAHGSVRFSLSVYNTEEDVAFIAEKLPPIIARLRELSPFDEEHKALQ